MAIRKIALTGGIATGKTYVANRLRTAGVPIVDADVLAREVVALGTPALAAIRQRFGPDVIRRDGTMDRIRVGQIIFKDKRARQDLEAIIHPAVQNAIDKYFASPIGADGKIWLASQDGTISIVTAKGDWEMVQVNALDDEVFATPVPADGELFVRTRSALYNFVK